MAQHYTKDSFCTKGMLKVFESIEDWFTNYPVWTIKGSIRYQRMGIEMESAYRLDESNENEYVYVWYRRIPKSVTGDPIGTFEIHYDVVKKKLLEIYFIA